MKTLNKVLSSVLAASMIISCCAMNAFAASKAHVLTINADKTTGLKAGDTITVELTIDNTADLTSLGYLLKFDTTALEIVTTKVSKLEQFIDKTWHTDIKEEDGGTVGDYWKYYMGDPTISYVDAGTIKCVWAGGAYGGVGTDDPDNEIKDDRLVGKYYIQVKSDAPNGKYTIELDDSIGTCYTADAGESQGALLTATPVTVTVGDPAPTTKDAGFIAEVEDGYGKTGIEFTLTTDATDVARTTKVWPVEFTTKVESAGTKASIGLNVTGIPSGVTVSATAKAY